MTGSNLHTLEMYLRDKLIGYVHFDSSTEQFSLEYTQDWQRGGFALSPKLPLDGTASSSQISLYLTNLLPENKGLDYLIESLSVSRNNTYALIKGIGFDTSGAILFLAKGSTVPATSFTPITEQDLVKRIENPEIWPMEVWDGKPRLSVAGVQSKLNLFHQQTESGTGCYGFGEGDLCSTYIIKFEKAQHRHLVMNEFITMNLAKLIGMQVAQAQILKLGQYKALSVKRFDRRFDADKNIVQRRHMIDACQALGFSVSKKYERNLGSERDVKDIREGVSLERLFSLAQLCTNPAQAKYDMLRWVLFNLLTGNADSHGKNYSFYVTQAGLTPTPWYDLVNVGMYPEFEQELSMAIGDEFNVENVQAYQLMVFADECDIKQFILEQTLKQLAKAIVDKLEQAVALYDQPSEQEQEYLLNYQSFIQQRCLFYLEQVEEMAHIKL